MSLEESKKEQFKEVLINLNNAMEDLLQFYNKNKDLEFVKKVLPEIHDLVKAKNELFSKVIDILEELCPSFNC